MNNFFNLYLVLIGSFITLAHGQANELSRPNNQVQGGKPPQMAISICTGQSEKAQCQFQGPRGLESGFCENTPDQQYFACNPSRGMAPVQGQDGTQATRGQQGAQADSPYGPKGSQVTLYPSHLKNQ